jgi:hypothetical protein
MNSPLMELTVEETESQFASVIPGLFVSKTTRRFFNKAGVNAVFRFL